MKVTRGAFVETCVLALVAIGTDLRPLLGGSFSIAEATPESFRPHVGGSFDVDGLRLKLAEVAARPASSRMEQFSLIFHGPADDELSDGIHRAAHHALGSFDLSLTSVGMPNPDRRTYQAVFSRLLEQSRSAQSCA